MQSVTVSRTSLFHIAAQYLGDATMWIYLAEFNRLRDPFIEELTVISLPSASNLRSGGIIVQ